MFKVMYARTRDGAPYLYTYRSTDQRTQFDYAEASAIKRRAEYQNSAYTDKDVAVVPVDQDCPDWCPWCGADLKADGYPLSHQMDPDGDQCPLKIRD
jgi:hypothetical protein